MNLERKLRVFMFNNDNNELRLSNSLNIYFKVMYKNSITFDLKYCVIK